MIIWRYSTVTQEAPWRYSTVTQEAPWRYCTATQEALWLYCTVTQEAPWRYCRNRMFIWSTALKTLKVLSVNIQHIALTNLVCAWWFVQFTMYNLICAISLYNLLHVIVKLQGQGLNLELTLLSHSNNNNNNNNNNNSNNNKDPNLHFLRYFRSGIKLQGQWPD